MLFLESTGSAFDLGAPVRGILAGFGTVSGAVAISSGGMLAPANAYFGSGADFGNLTVSGALTFAPGGIYQVRVDSAGTAADCVTATGAISVSGAILQHAAGPGAQGRDFENGRWLVMSAGNGVAGEFAQTGTTLTFYQPVLDYGQPNEVWLALQRSKTFLDDVQTPNQESVGQGLTSLESLNPDSDLVQAVLAATMEIPALYDGLSGDGHVTLLNGIMNIDNAFVHTLLHFAASKWLAKSIAASALGNAEALASINPRALETQFRNNLWVDAGYYRQNLAGDGNAGRATLKGPEISLGYDQISPFGWLGGVAVRYGDHSMDVASRFTRADIDSYSIGLYGGLQSRLGSGTARLVVGGAYNRHEIDVKRNVNPGWSWQNLESDYHVNSYQLFMEGAYAIPLGRIWLEPFADVSWETLRASGFVEKGGFAALYAPSQSQNNVSQLLGLRLALPTLFRVNVEAQAGWRHTYDRLNPAYSLGFMEGGDRFGIRGSTANRDEAVVDLRADYALRENLHVGLEGNAALGERATSVRGSVFIALEW